MSRRVLLILNPTSGAGRGGSLREQLLGLSEEILDGAELQLTEAPGHATEIVRREVERFDLIVAVGGDGTVHEVVNGLIDDGRVIHPGVGLGIVHTGTGGDLVKTLQVPRDLRAALERISTAELRPIDVLDVQLAGLGTDETVRRVCINVAGIGMNGQVVKRANEGSKRWGPRATFVGATVRSLAAHRPWPVRLDWIDGGGEAGAWEGPLVSAFVANGQYCGGGMWVGRGGSMEDGLADLTVVPQLSTGRMVLGFPRLFLGTMDRVEGVLRAPIRSLEGISLSGNDVLVELDGELTGRLPAKVDVLPKAMLIA
ncbi:MAG TPA: hypothetical protein ENK18_27555 [Deltaproteobacteria bacterium]|nr:hypothetical protein [Deltaproteobacteria bacterium]